MPREGQEVCFQLHRRTCIWLLASDINSLLGTPCEAYITVSNTKVFLDLATGIHRSGLEVVRAVAMFQLFSEGFMLLGHTRASSAHITSLGLAQFLRSIRSPGPGPGPNPILYRK